MTDFSFFGDEADRSDQPDPKRVVDLPRGGAVVDGKAMWFSLRCADGSVQDFSLAVGQLEPFVLGLRHFAAEARSAAGSEAACETGFVLSDAAFTATPQGGLLMELTVNPEIGIKIVVEASEIKPMLPNMLISLAPNRHP